jgi:hypothetical protein
MARSRGRGTAWLCALAMAAPSCTVDTLLKVRCRNDSDCVAGRVCVSGSCHDRSATDAGADAGLDHSFGDGPRPNFIFVTSERFNTTFRPPEVADTKCNQAARAAGLPGDFRAWLSTSSRDARDKLEGARGWIRTDGAPFADTVDDVVSGRIFNPPLLDERGHPVPTGPEDLVATGTDYQGLNFADANCHDWQHDIASQAAGGYADATTDRWTYADLEACGYPMRLYCFGVDQTFTVKPPPATGRRAFLSDTGFLPEGGIAAADAHCAREAAEAGLSGTFLALLPAGGISAGARFSAAGSAVWYRLDGVPINAHGSHLFSGAPLLTPLNVTSKGRYEAYGESSGPAVVRTGAPDPNVAVDVSTICYDWTGPDRRPSLGGYTSGGSLHRTGDWWSTKVMTVACDWAAQVYCFEI